MRLRGATPAACALLTLLALPFALFPGAATGARVFNVGDNRTTHYPHKALMARELHEGELPVWSRFKAFGYPILAESQTGVLYPPHLLIFWLVPMPLAYNLCILLHVGLAGCGAFLLARALGALRWSAFAAGLLFVLQGSYAQKLEMSQLLEARSLVPFAFLCAEAMAVAVCWRGSAVAGALLGTVLALQLLAGSVQESYYTTLFASLYLAVRRPRRAPLLLIAYAFLLALSAPQFVAGLELTPMTSRAKGLLGLLQERHYPFQRELLFWIFPYLHPAALTYVPQGFFGIVVPTLALLGLFRSHEDAAPRAGRRALCAVGILGLLFSLGGATPLFRFLLLIPGVRYFRYPQRCLVFVGLPLVLLAALGLEALAKADRPRTRSRRAILGLAGAGLMALSGVLLVRYAGGAVEGDRAPGLGLLAALLSGALLAGIAPLGALFTGGRQPLLRALAVAIVVAAIAELHTVFRLEDPTVARADFDRVTEAGAWLAEHPGLYRIHIEAGRQNPNPSLSVGENPYASSAEEAPETGVRARLLDAAEVMTTVAPTSMRLARNQAALNAALSAGPSTRSFAGSPALLGLLNVRYLLMRRDVDDPDLAKIVDGRFRLYENRRFLPRARFVARARHVEGADEIRALAGLDPETTILVHEGGAEMDGAAKGSVVVDESSLRSRRIRMQVTCDGPGYVTYAETFYPGWHARLDGIPAALVRANVCFMAVPIPSGRHELELTFWPSHFSGALALAGVGVVILVVIACEAARHTRDVLY